MEDISSTCGEEVEVDLSELLGEFDSDIETIVITGLPMGVLFDENNQKLKGVVDKSARDIDYKVSIDIQFKDGCSVVEFFDWSVNCDDAVNHISDQFSVLDQIVTISLNELFDEDAYLKIIGLPDGLVFDPDRQEISGIVKGKVSNPVELSVIHPDKSAEILSFDWNVFDSEQDLEDYIHTEKPQDSDISERHSEAVTEVVSALDVFDGRKRCSLDDSSGSIKNRLLSYGFISFVAVLLLFPVGKEGVVSGSVVPSTFLYIEAPYDGVLSDYLLKTGDGVEAQDSVVSYKVEGIKAELDRELLDLRLLKSEYQRVLDYSDQGNDWRLLKALSLSELASKQDKVSELYMKLENPNVQSPSEGSFYLNPSVDRKGKFVRKGEHIAMISNGGGNVVAYIGIEHLDILASLSDIRYYQLPQGEAYELDVIDVTDNLDSDTSERFPYQLTARVIDNQNSLDIGSVGKIEMSEGYVPLVVSLFN